MPVYCLEIRNTENWKDVRFRAYTTSNKRRLEFCAKVKRIDFTDSGHGLVTSTRELEKGERRQPLVTTLADHVRDCIRGTA